MNLEPISELLAEDDLAAINDLSALDDGRLDDIETAIVRGVEGVAAVDPVTDDALLQLNALDEGMTAVRAEKASRAKKSQDREMAASAIMRRVLGEADDDPQPVAASAGQPPLGAIASRIPGAISSRTSPAIRGNRPSPLSIVASGSETTMRDLRQVAEAFIKRQATFRGAVKGREMVPIATLRWQYPKDRRLSADDTATNADLIRRATSFEAITASGGLCAPLAGYYQLPMIASAARPIRDSLAQFGAERGGIRYQPALQLADFDGAVDVWTVANDADPGSDGPATKPCLVVDCGTEQVAVIEAVTRCVEFNNLGARAWPERVQNALELSMAAHARLAERELFTALLDGSTAVTAGQVLGTARDVLAHLSRAAVAYRQRHRTGLEFPLRAIFPGWLRDSMVVDLIRELPGAPEDRLAVANARIAQFFSARNVNVTWTLEADTAAAEMSSAQAAAQPITAWPTSVTGVLFHEGAWLFLDGGSLDLGLVRDSTLNSTNDYRIFAETFEGVAFVGVESDAITLDICPDGSTSATIDIAPCTTGS